MSRWFRLYADAMRNPKVMRLSDSDFRLWVKLLAVASENDGLIPCLADLKLVLNTRLDHLSCALKRLISGGLIDPLGDRYTPHSWAKYQYKSDTSTKRVTLHRQRRNVSETPPESDTESDTDSVPNGTGGEPPVVDLVKVLFDQGITFLGQHGVPVAKARPLIGRWNRDHGAGETIEALGAAQRQGVVDPVSWIEGRWKRRSNGADEWVSPC